MRHETKTWSETCNPKANMNDYICGLININTDVIVLRRCSPGDSLETRRKHKHTWTGVEIRAARKNNKQTSLHQRKIHDSTGTQRVHSAVCILSSSIKTIMSAEECAQGFRVIQRMGNDPYVRHM